MRPVIAAFVDGLKPDSIRPDTTPFLATLGKRRMKSEMGFSLTNYATMLTGRRVDEHHHWFLWRRRPETSPQRWMRWTGATLLPDAFVVHGGLNVMNSAFARFSDNTAYFRVPRLFNLPVKYWPQLDVIEKRFWDEDGYIPGHTTLFERLRATGTAYECPGMTRPDAERSIAVSAAHDYSRPMPFRFVLLGDIDPLSHRHTQEGAATREALGRLDRAVEKAYTESRRWADEEPAILLWSDHGHRVVEEKVDIFRAFRDAGDKLERHMHFLDGNYARFWFRDEAERRQVERVLAGLDGWGRTVDEKLAREQRVTMPDNRFGDLVWHLDEPRLFARTSWGFSSSVSNHGYIPDDPEMDAVAVSNLPFTRDALHMVDVLPTLLHLAGLPPARGSEGSPFLR